MMTKEGLIVNFMTPGAGVLARLVRPYKSYGEFTLFLLKSSYLLPGLDQTSYIFSNIDQGRV